MDKTVLLSKTIAFIRFPMILGIVIIHCYVNGNPLFIETMEENSWMTLFGYLMSNIISRSCVPLFFTISGFLFFYNVDIFDFNTYKSKLKRRVKTLLIPYLIWNLIGFLFILVYRLPFLRTLVPSLAKVQIDFPYFLNCFWCHEPMNPSFFGDGGLPVDFPLWFIRTLIILCVISPVIYWGSRKSCWLLSGLLICWIAGYWPPIEGFPISGILFFTLGATLSLHKLNPAEFLLNHKLLSNICLILYVATVVGDLLTRNNSNVNHYYHALEILFGLVAFTYLAAILTSKGKKLPKRLTDSTFFIYAFHGLISVNLRVGLIRVLNPHTNIQWFMIYVGLFFILCILSISIYYVMKKISPRLTNILVGGR